LGHWNDRGLLCVTGRKKELIVTSTGRNISPSRLETLLLQDSWIEQAFVTGDGREFPVALIVPNWQQLRCHLELSAGDPLDTTRLAEDATTIAAIQQRIDALMLAVADYERIRRFAVLSRAFSIERGELTVKSSLRRERIAENWSAAIDSLYRRGRTPGTGASNLDTMGLAARIQPED